ncbi:T-complex protein 1 subunit theta [Suillus subluteus]|nr:T-complex protein 1 subunit theta [Suillus subluteus]
MIREVEVIHPAAKLLVVASQVQESELGVLLQTWSSFSQENCSRNQRPFSSSASTLAKSESTNSHAPKPSVNSKEQPSNPFHSRRGTTIWKIIIVGSSTSNLALHYLNHFNIAATKVLPKFDLRRVACVFNATHLARIGAATPEEVGYTDILETIKISGDRVELRGATANHLDYLECAIDNGVNVIESLMKYLRLVPGAGATELELGKPLEVIPRTLAENVLRGAERINEVLSRLWVKHEQKGSEAWDVDFEAERDGTLLATDFEILDPLASKHLGHQAHNTSRHIRTQRRQHHYEKPVRGPKVPQQVSNWDED